MCRHIVATSLVFASMAAGAQGTAYVTSEKDDALTLIDTATLAVKGTVNGLSDDVTVVDVAAAKAIKSIPVGRVPYCVVIVE